MIHIVCILCKVLYICLSNYLKMQILIPCIKLAIWLTPYHHLYIEHSGSQKLILQNLFSLLLLGLFSQEIGQRLAMNTIYRTKKHCSGLNGNFLIGRKDKSVYWTYICACLKQPVKGQCKTDLWRQVLNEYRSVYYWLNGHGWMRSWSIGLWKQMTA